MPGRNGHKNTNYSVMFTEEEQGVIDVTYNYDVSQVPKKYFVLTLHHDLTSETVEAVK